MIVLLGILIKYRCIPTSKPKFIGFTGGQVGAWEVRIYLYLNKMPRTKSPEIYVC